MYHLLKLYLSVTGTHLKRKFGERLFVCDRDRMQREVLVTDTQTIKLGPQKLVLPMAQTAPDKLTGKEDLVPATAATGAQPWKRTELNSGVASALHPPSRESD